MQLALAGARFGRRCYGERVLVCAVGEPHLSHELAQLHRAANTQRETRDHVEPQSRSQVKHSHYCQHSHCVFARLSKPLTASVDQSMACSWTEPYFNPARPSPICEGDMILGSHTPPSLGVGQPLLFTHPQSSLDRANGTLLISTTGGARWTPLLTYQNGCHSYSQMVQFKDGKLGIVFDDGGEFPPNYNPAHGQCKGITR